MYRPGFEFDADSLKLIHDIHNVQEACDCSSCREYRQQIEERDALPAQPVPDPERTE
jgi:hypothetical protein